MHQNTKNNYVRVANVNERCCHIMCINVVNILTFVRTVFNTVWNEGRSGKGLKWSWDCFVSFRDEFNMMFVVCFWNAVVWFGQAWLCSAKYVKCRSGIIYEGFGTMLMCSWWFWIMRVYWIWFVTVLFKVSKLSKSHAWLSQCMEQQSAIRSTEILCYKAVLTILQIFGVTVCFFWWWKTELS